MISLRNNIPLYLFVEHDLFGKPVPTSPDHAPGMERKRPKMGLTWEMAA
jgi:hypothetical protein